MATLFLYHVVGDLTVGKPELVEFLESETVESAMRALENFTECGIPVWKQRKQKGFETGEARQQRFVGILNPLNIIAHLAKDDSLADQETALKTPVSQVVIPNNSILKEVDPGTRLIDALDMMKQGVRRLLVPKSVGWKGMSKRFSILYNGKWLKNLENPSTSSSAVNRSSTFSNRDTKFCCLSREDVLRFLIGCLGALAPIPLSSISSLGALTPHFLAIEASSPALHATKSLTQDPSAVAVVDSSTNGDPRIIGEISASKLWKCDYVAAAWALANLSAGQFVTGAEDKDVPVTPPDFSFNSLGEESVIGVLRPRKFSSRNIGFLSSQASPRIGRSMYRGRSAPLTCKATSSLAAVMAQMLSHRATHVWVTDAQSEDVLVGIVTYTDIISAVTRHPNTVTPAAP